jgi:dihydrofolate reductase
VVVTSLGEAVRLAADYKQAFIIGGADLYRATLPRADLIYLTLVEGEFSGDTWFPDWDEHAWEDVEHEAYPADSRNPYPHGFRVLRRRKTPSG